MSDRNLPRWGKSVVVLIPILSIALGAAIGAASGMAKFNEPVIRLAGHEAGVELNGLELKDAKPRVHLPGESEYNFGVMDRNEEQSYSFKVQNIGNGPLTLKVIDTTCKCTVGSIGNDTIAAGETADVTLTWETRSYDREFRQSATIETNDQSQREIIFSVYGKVQQLAFPDVPRMNGRTTRSEGQQFSTVIYGFRDKDLVIVGHQCDNKELAEFFDVTTEPLPREQWLDPDAKSAIQVTIDVKPGLPVGANRQVIAFETNKPDIALLDVALEITVVSDITLLKLSNIDDERNLIRLGAVPQETGKVSNLSLMVKGKYKDQVKFEVVEIDPEANLGIEFQPPVDLPNGKTRRFPFQLIVKKGGPAAKRMGSRQDGYGRIVLNTNHPEIGEFEIKVEFAVRTSLGP